MSKISTSNTAENGFPVLPETSAISSVVNGHKFVKIGPSYDKKNDFGAGVGPEMFYGIGNALVTIGMLFATAVATVAVGIATASLATAGITFGALLGATILLSIFIRAINPKF